MQYAIHRMGYVVACGLLAVSSGAHAQASPNNKLTKKPECTVPFPQAAMQKAAAGFKGETLALISFTVGGEFRSAQLLRSSGNRELDSAALRAAAEAHCKPLGDVNDKSLQQALIGIPYAFTFDNSRGSAAAQPLPVR